MKLIVGLGNPGRHYQNTRHNIGYMVVDSIAEDWKIQVTKKKWNAVYGKGELEGEEIILAKPITYMNLSGEAIVPMMNWYKLQPDDLIVICDDIHLPLGQLRIRERGSDGGHNGLASIIFNLDTVDFTRIRIGINEPPSGYDQADYVLAKFIKEELDTVTEMVETTCNAVKTILLEGVSTAMNRYNKRKKSEQE